MQTVRIQIDAEVVEFGNASTLLRLKTGFGDPEVRIAAECMEVLPC